MLTIAMALVPTLVASVAESEPRPRALYLLFTGDHEALDLRHAVRKTHAYTPPLENTWPHRVRLVDARGRVLSDVPVDLSGYCLDPAHRATPPHVEGCVVRPHAISVFVAVADLAAIARIVFEERVKGPEAKRPVWRTMCSVDAATLKRRIEQRRVG